MKIAVVCAHFRPEIGYQEVYIANACARLKHDVMVFTTAHVPVSQRSIIKKIDYSQGITENCQYAYKINRLKALPIGGHLVIGFGLKKAIKRYSPDVLLIIGVGKIFPYPLLKPEFNPICFFGDNQDFYSIESLKSRFVNLRLYFLRLSESY
jgi:hypothetical protein